MRKLCIFTLLISFLITSFVHTEGVQAAEKVDRDHTLIWAVPATPNGLDILWHNTLEAMEAIRNIYDSVLMYPPIEHDSGFLIPDLMKLQGMLAEKWSISEDGRTITVKLKEGIMSHYGNELTADDYIEGKYRDAELIGVANWANDGQKIYDLDKQIKKIDKYTFSITTDKPNPIQEAMLTHMSTHVKDMEEYKKHITKDDPDGTKWSSTNGAGHGPYKVVEFKPGQHLILEAFEDYWDKSYPLYFKKVIVKEIPASANRMALVLSGDVDAATYLSSKELKEVDGKPGVKVMHYSSNLLQRVEFNCQKPPFDNPLVRKALCFATPYDEIIDSVWLGYATQAKSIITSSYPGYNGSYWQYKLDYDEAKRLLAEAGYPDGFKTTIEVNAAIPQDEQIAIILKDSFKKIGVDVVIERVQAGDFYTKGNLKTFKGMYIFQDMAGVVDGGFSTKLWLQCPKGTAAQPSNFSGYCNEEVQRLYDETIETLDQELRNKNFARIQEITVWEEPAWILLTEPGYHIAVRDDINGLFWQTLQEIRWGKMYRE